MAVCWSCSERAFNSGDFDPFFRTCALTVCGTPLCFTRESAFPTHLYSVPLANSSSETGGYHTHTHKHHTLFSSLLKSVCIAYARRCIHDKTAKCKSGMNEGPSAWVLDYSLAKKKKKEKKNSQALTLDVTWPPLLLRCISLFYTAGPKLQLTTHPLLIREHAN